MAPFAESTLATLRKNKHSGRWDSHGLQNCRQEAHMSCAVPTAHFSLPIPLVQPSFSFLGQWSFTSATEAP